MDEKYVSVSALRELLSIPPDGDCEKCKHHRWNGCYNDELVRACEAIDDALEADVVEVVRCKDCVYYNTTGCAVGFGWCEGVMVSKGTSDDFFCAEGKQKPYECGADMSESNLDTTKGDNHD